MSCPDCFQPGDAVTLVNGGPILTVAGHTEGFSGARTGHVDVFWFDAHDVPQRARFLPDLLVRADDVGDLDLENIKVIGSGVQSTAVGDTVTLNSGGPLMTVTKIDGERCECTWFNDDGLPAFSRFPPASLTHFDPDEDAMAVDEYDLPTGPATGWGAI